MQIQHVSECGVDILYKQIRPTKEQHFQSNRIYALIVIALQVKAQMTINSCNVAQKAIDTISYRNRTYSVEIEYVDSVVTLILHAVCIYIKQFAEFRVYGTIVLQMLFRVLLAWVLLLILPQVQTEMWRGFKVFLLDNSHN